MVADKRPYTTATWDIFFHIYLDKGSYSVLVEQCEKLVGLSDSLRSWNASVYGRFLKMCTEYTMTELRRHWLLYIDMQNLPSQRTKVIREAFTKQCKQQSRKDMASASSARSSGPLVIQALQVSKDANTKYWSTGTTFSNPSKIAAATLLNPTFVYSLGGEGFFVQYGTDPLTPFHLAALFGNTRGSVSVADAVKAAKAEFSDWCSAFHSSVSSTPASVPVIRLFLGEATAVCRALRGFNTSGTLNLGVPVAPWKTHLIQLSKHEYLSGGAPVTFNVIDTSNLDDHIGLLNVLVATVPLIIPAPSSVIYTESLLVMGQDATKEFAERLYADITVFGLLIGLCPVDYLSGFNSRSNIHELMSVSKDAAQFHQATTWKSPCSGDPILTRCGGEYRAPAFDSRQLGTFLYDMYHQMFEQEDSRNFWRINEEKQNVQKAFTRSNLVHYTRESYVLLLKHLKDRLDISEGQWREVMDQFFSIHNADRSMPLDANNYNDFCVHLYRHGVYTGPTYHLMIRKIGIFLNWDTATPLVRIILSVPRKKMAACQSSLDDVGTPLLQCDIRGNWSHNIFTAVHVAFGNVVSTGTTSHPSVIFKEDPEGWKGASPLVVSFVAPMFVLTGLEPMENIEVCLTVRSTPAAALLINKIGLDLTIFGAKLLDKSLVHIVPEQPLPSRKSQFSSPISQPSTPGLSAQIGELGATTVEFDQECELVVSLTSKVSVENEEVKILFGSGATPQIAQLSPCVMRLTIGTHVQDVQYPFPVIGSQYRLRLARKSLYVEVSVGSTISPP